MWNAYRINDRLYIARTCMRVKKWFKPGRKESPNGSKNMRYAVCWLLRISCSSICSWSTFTKMKNGLEHSLYHSLKARHPIAPPSSHRRLADSWARSRQAPRQYGLVEVQLKGLSLMLVKQCALFVTETLGDGSHILQCFQLVQQVVEYNHSHDWRVFKCAER